MISPSCRPPSSRIVRAICVGRRAWAEAVTDVKVRRFSRNRFFSLVNESPELRPQLFVILCDEMSAAQDQMLLLGRKSTEERVVSFLLAAHRKNGVGKSRPSHSPR
jgi:CRP/FNR family transcriptional regulator